MNKIADEETKELARVLAVKLFEEAETKRVFKEALNEWLDKKFLEFKIGFAERSLQFILIMLFGAFITFVMWSQGYRK